jgi:predicted amino acid-binding ACT domain protein
MGVSIKRVEYYRTETEDHPGEAYQLLSQLAKHEVNLLAVSGMPIGPTHNSFTLFPESSERLIRAAEKLNLTLIGPYPALLICGDDRLGALVDFHRKLADARINVYATSGVSDGAGRYGYVIHVRPEDFEAAAHAVGAT